MILTELISMHGSSQNSNSFVLGAYYFKPSGSQTETHGASHDGINPVCHEPKYVGPCRAAMPRFYYNQETKACEQFIFGGCSPNGNNFVKKEDCEKACLGKGSDDEF